MYVVRSTLSVALGRRAARTDSGYIPSLSDEDCRKVADL
jgi:hypothetical protein